MSTLGLIFCLLGSVFTKRRHFRPDPFLSCAERWQDSRAVRDSRGPCSERRPLPGRIFARCVPERRFAGLFGCMARISCQSQPVFGCMARESCRELAIFPSEAAFGMHGAQNLPRIDARERTAREYCHCQSGQGRIRAQSRHRQMLGGRTARAFCHRRAPGNAPWRNLVTTSRPGTHFAHILPSPGAWERIASISCHRQTSENAQRRHTATASRPSRSALHVGEWVQSLGCAVGFGAQHFLCEGVGIPPSRGLTAGNDFESALFRWATMSPLRVLQSCAVLCAEAKSALTFI